MISKSSTIDLAINIAIANGNSVLEISEGWSKIKQVVHMRNSLDSSTRQSILSQAPSLRYWKADPTPHNRGDEGFTSDQDQVAISFPRV